VKRREFMLLLGVAMTARSLRAHQKAMPVIGFLSIVSPGPSYEPPVAARRQGLRDAGYVEGQNVAIEYRWAEGRQDQLPALAADLAGREVDDAPVGRRAVRRSPSRPAGARHRCDFTIHFIIRSP
jgi:putative ABC transport system substrate-binding protein